MSAYTPRYTQSFLEPHCLGRSKIVTAHVVVEISNYVRFSDQGEITETVFFCLFGAFAPSYQTRIITRGLSCLAGGIAVFLSVQCIAINRIWYHLS